MEKACRNQGRVTGRSFGSFLATACVLACLATASADSAMATTGSGITLVVKGVMTNSSFVLVHGRGPVGELYVVGSNGTTATFGRGTHVIFRITNHGSKPYLPAILAVPGPYTPAPLPADKDEVYTVAAQRVAPPGGKVDLSVTLYFRGQYKLLQLFHKKPVGKPIDIRVT